MTRGAGRCTSILCYRRFASRCENRLSMPAPEARRGTRRIQTFHVRNSQAAAHGGLRPAATRSLPKYALRAYAIAAFVWKALIVLSGLSGPLAFGQSPYSLPADTDQPVLVLESRGGRQAINPLALPPVIQVFSDGRIVAGATSPQFESCEWRMPKADWHWFFDEFIELTHFFELQSGPIQEQIEQHAGDQVIVDAPTTVIRVRAAERDHKVEVFAARYFSRQLPDCEELKSFVLAEQRLRWLAALAHAGGADALDAILERTREYLAKELPESTDLQREDLASAVKFKSGDVQVIFRKTITRMETGKPSELTVTVRISGAEVHLQHSLK